MSTLNHKKEQDVQDVLGKFMLRYSRLPDTDSCVITGGDVSRIHFATSQREPTFHENQKVLYTTSF